MIYPAKYNGINFSYDFTRESQLYNFDNQRLKNILLFKELKYLSFFVDSELRDAPVLNIICERTGVSVSVANSSITDFGDNYICFYKITTTNLFHVITAGFLGNTNVSFSLESSDDKICSEIYTLKSNAYLSEKNICEITASNKDDRHGYLSGGIFGFFKHSILKSDIFVNKTVNYEYSYSRKKILSSENQIAKRFTFQDLTMYNQNLLKWICHCENLYIDGVSYQLISDFTELESDLNSEIMNLQADFVEVNQSFFANPSTD